jgi:serine/threonine-protein kinase
MREVFAVETAGGRFRQRAALKIVHRRAAGDDWSDAFKQERQILASLEHPSIARLIDGGVTDDGARIW